MKVSTGVPSPASVLERLESAPPRRRLPGRNRTKADLLIVDVDDAEIAVKDYSARPYLIRHSLGRWLTRRESRAYEAAGDLPGLVRFVGRLGPFRLATVWFDAMPLSRWDRDAVPPQALERLRAIVAALHERGVALGDLHHRDVLVAPDGGVRVIDLATAYVAGPDAGRWRRHWFRRFRDQDRIALARLCARFSGGDPEAAVDAVGGAAAARYRFGRRLKATFDRLRGRKRGGTR